MLANTVSPPFQAALPLSAFSTAARLLGPVPASSPVNPPTRAGAINGEKFMVALLGVHAWSVPGELFHLYQDL